MSENLDTPVESSVLPTLAYLRECFDYNPITGVLTWKARPREHYQTDRGWKSANGRCAGKQLKPRASHDYIHINLFGRMFSAHRIAYALHHGLDLKDVPENIDHRNGRTSDNRAANLRPAAFSNNAKNRVINRNNTSGRKGVSYHKGSGKWQMTIQGKHMGLYDTVDEAGDAYDAEAEKRFGEFNRQDPWKRKEVIGDCTLYLGDCLDILPFLGRFDAVVTDPPYGIGESSKKVASRENAAQTKDYGAFDWDEQPASPEQIAALLDCSQHQIIFGGNYFHLAPSSCWLVWDKQNTGDFADCELAWTNLPGAVRRIYWRWNGMIRKGQEERFHPTQKPLGVMRWALQRLPNASRTICDPFMGSGTTGVASVREGLSFVGIEKDERYFEIACKRIAEAIAQPADMFAASNAQQAEQLSILETAR